jgi:hypothetical protein
MVQNLADDMTMDVLSRTRTSSALGKDRGVWNLPFVRVIREGNAMADQLARQPVNHCG